MISPLLPPSASRCAEVALLDSALVIFFRCCVSALVERARVANTHILIPLTIRRFFHHPHTLLITTKLTRGAFMEDYTSERNGVFLLLFSFFTEVLAGRLYHPSYLCALFTHTQHTHTHTHAHTNAHIKRTRIIKSSAGCLLVHYSQKKLFSHPHLISSHSCLSGLGQMGGASGILRAIFFERCFTFLLFIWFGGGFKGWENVFFAREVLFFFT